VAQAFPIAFGEYELLRRLGRGGMAEVFLAKALTHDGQSRLVALKRMHPSLSEDQGAVDMLVEEARLAMRFEHPNIAATFELGCHDSQYFFIMEYIDGLDLATMVQLGNAAGQKLDPTAVAYVMREAARGLHYAHTVPGEDGKPLGIVHRDVSPQNILASRTGAVKVIDFGVAKVGSRMQQTLAGVIKGKYAYMSPEQAGAAKLDARSDVFSLGICAWEMLTGRNLFRPNLDGDEAPSPFAILRMVREEPVPSTRGFNPNIPTDLEQIVLRALQRDLGKRWGSAGELADALDAWFGKRAPPFDARAMAGFVRGLVAGAPEGAVSQDAVATPPLGIMSLAEFAPSGESIVAPSPLEERAKAARAAKAAPEPAARVQSMLESRTRLPDLEMPADSANEATVEPVVRRSMPRGGAQTSEVALPASIRSNSSPDLVLPRPPRRAVRGLAVTRRVAMRLLWAGIAVLLLATVFAILSGRRRARKADARQLDPAAARGDRPAAARADLADRRSADPAHLASRRGDPAHDRQRRPAPDAAAAGQEIQ